MRIRDIAAIALIVSVTVGLGVVIGTGSWPWSWGATAALSPIGPFPYEPDPVRLPDRPVQDFTPEQQAVADVYYGYHDAHYLLVAPQDDEEVRAALSPYANEHIVEYIVGTFAAWRAEGLAITGAPTSYGDLQIKVDGQSAYVDECRDCRAERFIEIATGKVTSQGIAGTLMQADLQQTPTGWQIVHLYAKEGGCA